MDLDLLSQQLFQGCVLAIGPAWLSLLISPGSKLSRFITLATTMGIAVVYVAAGGMSLMMPAIENGGLVTFEEVQATMHGANAAIVTVFWVHYLCFDLLAGQKVALEAEAQNMPKLMIAPGIIMTCLLGPFGYLVSKVMMFVHQKTCSSGKGKKD